jgi:carbon-monoxide dehydrogenase small subunit
MVETLSLTVNGERRSVAVSPRTQLAEVLRDHLDLTGTHLGCEQGVCGACTVLMDGRPVRSCITFAHSCEDAQIETIEGHSGDAVMDRLRDAFSRHHALQCGFCTPGMLAAARDIVARFDDPDEATIRHELSGNLCRCTGYVGIVGAIRDVIAQRKAEGGSATAAVARAPAPRQAFAPFTPIAGQAAPSGGQGPARGRVASDGNWTVVERRFTLAHPPATVWALFRDLGRVAPCVPGATVSEIRDDGFTGTVEIRFGPIRARFGGEGTHENDDSAHAGRITGQGDDKNGKSRVRGELQYRITPGETPGTSGVAVEFRFEIQGMLAQFNRPELVTGLVDHILGQFVANCDAVLSGEEAGPARNLSVLAVGWSVLRSALRSLFGRK